MKKRQIKRLFACIMAIVMAISVTVTPAFASEAEIGEDEINQTLEAVFSFLNSQKTQLHASERVDYEVPVGENIVSVTVENQPLMQARTPTYGDNRFEGIKIDTSYIYTLTIQDFYSGSGTIVFKVNYHVWRTNDPNTVRFRLTPDQVTIDVTLPSGCTLVTSSATYDPAHVQSSLIKAYGSVEFKTALLGVKKTFSLEVRLWSFEYKDHEEDEGYILADYQYEV